MILYHSEKSIRDLSHFAVLCFVTGVLWSILLISYSSELANETWLPNITEISPPKLHDWTRPWQKRNRSLKQWLRPPLTLCRHCLDHAWVTIYSLLLIYIFAGLLIWLFWSQILKFWLFLNAFGFFLEIKKAWQNLDFSGFFSVGKAWIWKNIVRAVFITNLFWKSMQTAQNIEKNLLLP